MIVKEQILREVKNIDSPKLLNQLFGYLRLVRSVDKTSMGNRDMILQYAGTLSHAEAGRINKSISEAFDQIEGEW